MTWWQGVFAPSLPPLPDEEPSMANEPAPDRTLLLLAAGIAEWAGALDHLDALERMGQYDPRRRPSLRVMLTRELDTLMEQWPRITTLTPTREQVVSEARQYVTKHQHALDDLIGE